MFGLAEMPVVLCDEWTPTQVKTFRLPVNRSAKGLITRAQAAEEMGLGVRQVKRLVKELERRGDKVAIHGLRGRPSNHRMEDVRDKAIGILKQEVYRGFRPTLASEYWAKKHALY